MTLNLPRGAAMTFSAATAVIASAWLIAANDTGMAFLIFASLYLGVFICHEFSHAATYRRAGLPVKFSWWPLPTVAVRGTAPREVVLKSLTAPMPLAAMFTIAGIGLMWWGLTGHPLAGIIGSALWGALPACLGDWLWLEAVRRSDAVQFENRGPVLVALS